MPDAFPRRTVKPEKIRPRCQAMTRKTFYEDAHPCPYAAEDGGTLCRKHEARVARGLEVLLADGTVYTPAERPL
jgi:hypothetical protein